MEEGKKGIKETVWMTQILEYPGNKKFIKSWLVKEKYKTIKKKPVKKKDVEQTIITETEEY